MTNAKKAALAACLLCLLCCLPAFAEQTDAEAYRVSDETTENGGNGEMPLAYDLPEGFVYVRDVIPDVIEEMRYATEHNFTGMVVDGYEAGAAILTKEAALALKEAADALRLDGYRVKIFDAYRPRRAVRFFVDWSKTDDMRMRDEFYPEFKNKKLLVDQGYIARNSAHTRGSAIDMTIVYANGTEVDMGTCFDYFGKKAWHGASGLTQEQTEMRALLRSVMESCGFKAFEHEWWHYRLYLEPYKGEGFDFIVH